MARLPRLALAGQAHLVALQCAPAQLMFIDDEDRRCYRTALLESSREHAVAIHAYALLDDQVLLLATPATAQALARFMQGVARRYVRRFNRRHGRQGPLWAGRFRSVVIDPASLLLSCVHFVEQLPVREGWVAQAGEWAWSSSAHHGGRRVDVTVSEHEAYWRLGNTPFERQARYVQASAVLLDDDVVRVLAQAIRRGVPIGPPAFVAGLAESAGRPMTRPARGRPRRTQITNPPIG